MMASQIGSYRPLNDCVRDGGTESCAHFAPVVWAKCAQSQLRGRLPTNHISVSSSRGAPKSASTRCTIGASATQPRCNSCTAINAMGTCHIWGMKKVQVRGTDCCGSFGCLRAGCVCRTCGCAATTGRAKRLTGASLVLSLLVTNFACSEALTATLAEDALVSGGIEGVCCDSACEHIVILWPLAS